MKTLVVADLHYSLKHFDWLERQAGNYDLVIIAGDLLDLAGHAELDAQIIVVLKYLERIRQLTPVLVCSGNHDGDVRNEDGEFVATWLLEAGAPNLWVDGQSYAVAEDLVTICPWWDGPVTLEAMQQFLESEKQRPHERWLWLHHAPPGPSPISWTGSKYVSDEHLVKSIAEHQPAFVFSGHIHNSPFSEEGSWAHREGATWIFNPGKSIGDYPPHIILDLDAMTARWISWERIEELDLAADDSQPEIVR